jgi:large subunit ribosomal protein L9
MEVILLEKIRNLGGIGDKVRVKAGYARNFLFPQNKAIFASTENLAKLESMRAELEKAAHEALAKAEERARALNNLELEVPVKASEEGKLFGSVGIREIVLAIKKRGIEVSKSEVSLPQGAIHQIGEYDIVLQLHTDVTATIKIKVVADVEKK